MDRPQRISDVTSEKVKVVGMGDSITFGFPYSPSHSWFNIVSKRLKITGVNQGICGDTTAGMINRFHQDVLQFNPQYVTIMGGTNDLYMGVPIEDIINNILAMVRLAIEHEIVPIVGIPIPCNELEASYGLEQLHKELKQVSIIQQIDYIDFYEALVGKNGSIRLGLDSDGVHPNLKGYIEMADVAHERIGSIIF